MQPNPPYAQYPPVPPPPPTPKRRGRKILIAALAVFGVIVIGSAIGNAGGTNTGTTNAAGDAGGTVAATDAATQAPPATKAPPPKPAAAKVGTEVRDGKFAFTVTKVDTGVDHVGNDQFTRQEPQGQYVLVHVTVKNIGDEAQLFDASSQTLIDAQGRKYDADSGAAILLDDSHSFLNNINPGNSVTGILVYDVPNGLTLASIELHDSPFSGGVTVTLAQ